MGFGGLGFPHDAETVIVGVERDYPFVPDPEPELLPAAGEVHVLGGEAQDAGVLVDGLLPLDGAAPELTWAVEKQRPAPFPERQAYSPAFSFVAPIPPIGVQSPCDGYPFNTISVRLRDVVIRGLLRNRQGLGVTEASVDILCIKGVPMAMAPRNPTPSQVHAINNALNDLSGIKRKLDEDLVKALSGFLLQDELPEKMLGVKYRDNPNTLMVVTNARVLFVRKGQLSSKLQMDDFPCDQIARVEYKPGMFQNGIFVWVNRGRSSPSKPATPQKVECYGQPTEGKDRAQRMAEHLASKVRNGDGSITNKPEEARLYAIEGAVKQPGQSVSRGALKKLNRVLDEGEMPVQVADHVVLDDRHGLNISGMGLPMGLLAATDRHLIFVNDEPFSKDIRRLPYDGIERLDCSKGMVFGSVSIWTEGVEEKFDKLPTDQVDAFVQCIESNTGMSPSPSDALGYTGSSQATMQTKTVSDFVATMEPHYREIFKYIDTRALEGALEPGEAINRMTFVSCGELSRFIHSALVATDSRLIAACTERAVVIPYSEIERVTYTKGLIFGSLSVWVDGGEHKMDKLGRAEAEEWARHLEDEIG